jgi:hypothetical protein
MMLATLKESIRVPAQMICLLHPWQVNIVWGALCYGWWSSCCSQPRRSLYRYPPHTTTPTITTALSTALHSALHSLLPTCRFVGPSPLPSCVVPARALHRYHARRQNHHALPC